MAEGRGRKLSWSVAWRWRRATRRFRVLPDFVVIGAQRAGTTSLFSWLGRHPQVRPAFRKEVHFFDLHHERGLDWYRANFDLSARVRRPTVAGEATPNYLAHPLAPKRMHTAIPDAKLVALLRDPVDRAHSAWRLRKQQGMEALSFADAIRHELERLGADPLEPGAVDRVGRPAHVMTHEYLAKSRYAESLERWLALYPPGSVLAIRSEDLFTRPEPTLGEITAFLGVSAWDPQQFARENAATAEEVDPGLRRDLEAYFAPHNVRLGALLGRTDWW